MDKSVYDCMAYMIRMLLDNIDTEFFENYRAISSNRRKQFNKMLYEKFSELLDENGNAKAIFAPNSIDENLSGNLYRFADNCVEHSNLMLLVQLITKLDIGLAEAAENSKTDIFNMKGLNSNYDELEIQILPRCYSSWAHNNKDRNCSNTLNNFLNHFYFIDTRELKRRTGCDVSHCILSSDNFLRAASKGYLKIGITPFGDEIKLNIQKQETENGVCEFQITGLSNEEELMKNIESIFEKAKLSGVDILCFPEMLGTELIKKKILEILTTFPEDDGEEYPVLTFCPTSWKHGKNIATVFNSTGRIVAEQSKQKAYEFEEDGQYYREGLKPDRHIQLIHCDGIGRLGILICRDALEREYVQAMLELLKITLLIIPSYSTGYFDFLDNLQTCSAYDCNVVWINTCSAIPKSKRNPRNKEDGYVGFIYKTGKRTMFRNGQYPFKFSSCKKNENEQACRMCLYIEKLYFDYAGYK